MTNSSNQERYPEMRHDRQICVHLACGCTVWARNHPMNRKVTYPCPNNMGHGYRVRWIRWESNGRSGMNQESGQ